MKRLPWRLLTLALLAPCCIVGNAMPYTSDGIVFVIPRGTTVRKTVSVDFDTFLFMRQGRIVLEGYAGNAPGFPMADPPHSAAHNVTANMETYSWTDAKGRRFRESLWRTMRGFPARVHFWYHGDSPQDARVADGIIKAAHVAR